MTIGIEVIKRIVYEHAPAPPGARRLRQSGTGAQVARHLPHKKPRLQTGSGEVCVMLDPSITQASFHS